MERIEIDRTDEERADLVKEFIRDYWLTAALVVGGSIAAVGGINYYKSSKIAARNESAQRAEKAFKLDDKADLAAAETAVKDLQDSAPTSGYATLASLSLAKAQFEKGEFDKAIASYDNVINNHDFAEFRDVAKMRKARVQVAAKRSEQARETLKSVETDAHRGDATLLSGDIHLAANEFAEALALYEKGLENAENKRLFEQRITLVKIKQQQALGVNKPAEQPSAEIPPATTDTNAQTTVQSETQTEAKAAKETPSAAASASGEKSGVKLSENSNKKNAEKVIEQVQPLSAQTQKNAASETTVKETAVKEVTTSKPDVTNLVDVKSNDQPESKQTGAVSAQTEKAVEQKAVEQKAVEQKAADSSSTLPVQGQAEEVTSP